MNTDFTLISHTLCPYVQRAAIVLAEKKVSFERIFIDLANKPDWFRAVSPLGKVPLLKTEDGTYLFESAAIVEFIDEVCGKRLHPDDPAERANHRAYVEFASQILNGIGALYNAAGASEFETARQALRSKFEHLDRQINKEATFFAGETFSLVDAAFAPVFRYFDVFDTITDLDMFNDLAHVKRWRQALAKRTSVMNAVTDDYEELLRAFLLKRGSWITGLVQETDRPAQAQTA